MRLGKAHRITTVWAAAAVLSFAGAAATAQPAFAHPGKGGNNGTIKIHDGSEKNPKSNNPHLQCPIIVSFQGFDDASDAYTVDIHTIPPSSKKSDPQQVVTDSGTFNQNGDFSYSPQAADFGSATPNKKGEYHVYVHVTATTSNGAIVKNKAVWLTACPTPTGSSTVSASSACNTSNTIDYTVDASSTKSNPPATGDYTFTPTSGSPSTGTFDAGSSVLSVHDSGTLDVSYDGQTDSTTGDTSTCTSVLPTQTSKPPVTKPSVAVLGEHFTKGSKLPFTGPAAPLVPLGLAALGLVFGGLALATGGRRRALIIE